MKFYSFVKALLIASFLLCYNALGASGEFKKLEHEHREAAFTVSDEFKELVHKYREAKETKARYSLLFKMENLTRGGNPATQETLEQLLQIGQKYYKLRDYYKSLSLFSELADNSMAPPDMQVRALRMLGQVNFFSLNNNLRAEEAYSKMLNLLDKSSNYKVRKMRTGFYFGEALEKLAWVCQASGAYEKAVSVRERLLSEAKISDKRRQIAYLETARDCVKIGSFEKAGKIYDKLFKDYPHFGKENGRIINVKMERINAHGYDRFDPDRIDLIENLWNNQENRTYLRIYNIGRQLVYLKEQIGDYEASARIARELLNEIEQKYENFSQEDIRRYNIDDAYVQASITLAGILTHFGDLYNSASIYEKLLEKYPKTKFTEYVLKELALIYSKRDEIEVEGIIKDINETTQINSLELQNLNGIQNLKEIFIPKASIALQNQEAFVLDLASGKLLNPAAKVCSEQTHKNLLKLGKGDIAWDGSLVTVRKAKALTVSQESHRPLKCTPGRWCNWDRLPNKVDLPYSVLVVTNEDIDYLITIRKIKSDGIRIIYKKLNPDEVKSYLPARKKM